MIHILIADDNAFITGGMAIVLDSYPDIEVIQTVENGQEAVNYCKAHPVDVVLLDIRMPVMDGVTATKQIVEQTETKVMILTTFDDDQYISEALENGAKGYLLKNNEPDTIVHAIRSVALDQHVIQTEIFDKVKEQMQTGQTITNEPQIDLSDFTEREIDIMRGISRGLSNKEIGKTLFISDGTVANYISTILSKTGLAHRTQIAIYFLTGKIGD
ncbi:response regulator transcription factor [Isobaculum melis]|uniref:DNA-binding response regulator, NarL/FixJ family, contains REC and HTH domains n=1 Tax=Isobaculum melis TaxID=142588 RepID=A0A1H9QR11_9LACT|nr:response regulator transcription factor [Isobaculum melis]SER62946.1 DNA-binding response regulator, NarL/FixJ family, contains REC and HTH domains [Isobaculum melis]